MQIEITRKFQKQVEACKDEKIRNQIAEIINNVRITDVLSEIKNVKKLSGSKNTYRIRISQYR
jgi:mRNA-degrading endonuclease RelE of RelBE toxin-antitoxin system